MSQVQENSQWFILLSCMVRQLLVSHWSRSYKQRKKFCCNIPAYMYWKVRLNLSTFSNFDSLTHFCYVDINLHFFLRVDKIFHVSFVLLYQQLCSLWFHLPTVKQGQLSVMKPQNKGEVLLTAWCYLWFQPHSEGFRRYLPTPVEKRGTAVRVFIYYASVSCNHEGMLPFWSYFNLILHTTKFQIELTLEPHRRVTDMDPVHSGKSLSNKQCSPSSPWPCIHGSSQLHIVDQVALWYLLEKFCVKVHPQSLNLLCSRVTCSFIHLQQKRDKHIMQDIHWVHKRKVQVTQHILLSCFSTNVYIQKAVLFLSTLLSNAAM